MLNRVGERKERADKKREVKPIISSVTKDIIFRLSHVTHRPIKDVCEFLTAFMLQEKSTFDDLSHHFKRNIQFNNTIFFGDMNAQGISKRLNSPGGSVSFKFKKTEYELLAMLAYALDCTPTRAAAIVLEMATRDIVAVNEYVREYMVDELTEGQIQELRRILTYINKQNEDKSSWLTILSLIVGEIRPATKKLRELVEEFLRK